MALSIKPIGDRVVVEAAPAEEKQLQGCISPIQQKKNHLKVQ